MDYAVVRKPVLLSGLKFSFSSFRSGLGGFPLTQFVVKLIETASRLLLTSCKVEIMPAGPNLT